MSDILPVFQAYSFLFEGDSPPHIEAHPTIPRYVGMYTLFGTIDGVRPYTLAVDVEHLFLAEQLAEARKAHQEDTIKLYKYSDDIYVGHPDGFNQRTYFGHSL